MAAYYNHHHQQQPPHGPPEIPPDHLHHTLVLMNTAFPAYSDHHHHPPHPLPPPPPSSSSHNILLLNSAAAAAAAASSNMPPSLHHQLLRPLPTHQENITLYGHPQLEAREVTRPRQGLSLSLSSQGHHLPPPAEAGVGGDAQTLVLVSKYLKPTQELLEEVVHAGVGLLSKKRSSKPSDDKQGGSSLGVGGGAGAGNSSGDGDAGGGVQLNSAERQELQLKKAKLVAMLEETEQRYRQYHNQMQVVVTSFEQGAGIEAAKTYTALALKTISKQFRCLKDAIQAQIKATGKSLGEEGGDGLGSGSGSGSSAGKMEGSRLKYIDHQIRQQRALQQLGMVQNHNAWRPQRGLPERSVSVLRAWLFEHFLHPYPKDSDKVMLAKQTGLTRSQVSNWFINARVRLWKPMIEEMYTEEFKEQEHNGSEDKTGSKHNSNESNSPNGCQDTKTGIADQIQAKGSLIKEQNIAISSSPPSSISIPTTSPPHFKGNNNNSLHQNQLGFTLTGSFEMEGILQGSSPKRLRNDEVLHCGENNREILIKFGNDKQGRDNGYPMISGAMNLVGEELGSYPTIGEMGRFGTQEFAQATRFLPGNGISLSLGLPPCENQQQQQLNISATNHSFLSPNQNIQFHRANDFGSINSPSSHSSAAAFEFIDIQNRKGFAAQLLPDFVA